MKGSLLIRRNMRATAARAAWRAERGSLPLIKTLVADPPWPFDAATRRGGAGNHYDLLSMDDIKAYPLPPLDKDCRLFMWRVASMQDEALAVVWAWGFGPVKSELSWTKLTSTGKVCFGTGHQMRNSHEICLIGVRGKPQRLAHLRSSFDAPRGEHSEKPDKFYEIVQAMSPGPYYELFARKRRPGWMTDGDERGLEVALAAT